MSLARSLSSSSSLISLAAIAAGGACVSALAFPIAPVPICVIRLGLGHGRDEPGPIFVKFLLLDILSRYCGWGRLRVGLGMSHSACSDLCNPPWTGARER